MLAGSNCFLKLQEFSGHADGSTRSEDEAPSTSLRNKIVVVVSKSLFDFFNK